MSVNVRGTSRPKHTRARIHTHTHIHTHTTLKHTTLERMQVLGVDFASLAARIFAGEAVEPMRVDQSKLPYIGVKAPQFSWGRLLGADPVLGVEMASTGEVGCLADSKEEAFLKALLSTNLDLPKKTILIMAGDQKDDFLPSARALAAMG